MEDSNKITELLKNYKDLYDNGVISKEEYEEKKASLLESLNNSATEEKPKENKIKLTKLQKGLIIGVAAVLITGVWGYAIYRIVGLANSNKDQTIYKLKKDEVFYGYYPQTEMNAKKYYGGSAKFKELKAKIDTALGEGNPSSANENGWTNYGFLKNNLPLNNSYYKDVTVEGTKYRAVYLLEYRSNSTLSDEASQSYQKIAGYQRATRYYFRFDPIPWRKLETNNNETLLMSVKALDAHEFSNKAISADQTDLKPNNYKESSIRNWLNTSFYQTAFNEKDKEKMVDIEVDNSLASTGDTENSCTCENTSDKVTLLSASDILNESYNLKDVSRRECPATDYAWIMGYSQDYWTRTPANGLGNAAKYVTKDGLFFKEEPTHRTYRGVVPVIEITK